MGRKIRIFIFTLLPFAFCLLPLRAREARAQDMSSTNFKLQGGNFNMTSGNKSSTNFKLSDVVGQTAASLFSSKGYVIQAGFLNSAAGEAFAFSVSPQLVDFGILSPSTPVEKNVQIAIANGNVAGYLVKASENGPLSTLANAEILDTVCDKGQEPCSVSSAGRWKENTTYGFGYHMSGKTVSKDFFTDVSFFRPFAATKRNEQPVVIMESKARKVRDQAIMTLRLNTNPNQPVGRYRNVISFVALAGI